MWVLIQGLGPKIQSSNWLLGDALLPVQLLRFKSHEAVLEGLQVEHRRAASK